MAFKLTTKVGDNGESKIGPNMLPKDDQLFEVLGAIDATITALDLVSILVPKDKLAFLDIQRTLANLSSKITGYGKSTIEKHTIAAFDIYIQETEASIPNVLVTFNTKEAHAINEVRLRVRTLERRMTPLLREKKITKTEYQYLNRLSDYLFCVAARLQS